ncbi:MAG: hypothetical protein ACREYC_24390, partial [Gammaproteobacteria bacterium]
RVPRKLKTKAQAERCAWRNVAGFVRYQIALAQVAAPEVSKGQPKSYARPERRWTPSDALARLVSVQRRAQLEWGERLE